MIIFKKKHTRMSFFAWTLKQSTELRKCNNEDLDQLGTREIEREHA